MSRTRAELDSKLTRLQARVSELTPQRLGERYVPDYFVDRVIGGVLTIVGLKMAWSRYRWHRGRRERVQAAMAGYSRW